MTTDKVDINTAQPNGGQKTHTRQPGLRAAALLADREGALPIWIRAPVRGPEFYTGLTRAKLYELAGRGLIRSVSIREPGQVRGCRLFDLRSILDFIENCKG